MAEVTYDVKELLDKLSDALTKEIGEVKVGLSIITSKLDSKAENSRVDALERLVEDALKRIGVLEQGQAGAQAVSRTWRFLFATIGVVVLGGLISLIVFALEAGLKGNP